MRAVLFDLDGTILDRTGSLWVYLHRQTERLPELFETVPFADYATAFLELDENGHVARDAFFHRIAERFSLPPGMRDTLLADFQTHFPDTCVPFPRAHQTLSTLRTQGLRMGLVTNGRIASQQPKIDGLGISSYFGAILISEAEGVRKPDAEIFRRATSRLGVTAAETVMVGDNPEADIRGAKAFGMGAIWKRDTYWSPPVLVDAVIDGLDELPRAIGDLA